MEDEDLLQPKEDDINFFNSGIKQKSAASRYDALFNQPAMTLTGLTGIGNSKYDQNVSFSNLGEIGEIRARTQPWIDKFGAGVARIGVKALGEIVKMPGIAAGVIGGIGGQFNDLYTGKDNNDFMQIAFNNPWIKAINEISEDIKTDLLPVYVKKAIQNGDIVDNFLSIDFWATEGADGIGYILSMLAPGALINKFDIGARLAGISRFAKIGDKMDEAVKVLGKFKMTPRNANLVLGTTANTVFESAAEAQGAMEAYENHIQDQLDSGEINQEKYNELFKKVGEIGRNIFVSNAVILAGPNAMMSKILWGKARNKIPKGIFKKSGASTLEAITKPGFVTRAGRTLASGIKTGAVEGFWEEGLQSTAEQFFTKRAKAGKFEGAVEDLADFYDSIGTSYVDMITETEGQKAILLGAMFGGIMGGAHGATQSRKERESSNKLIKSANSVLSNMYNVFNGDNHDAVTGKLKLRETIDKAHGLETIEKLSAEYDLAIETGDINKIKQIKDIVSTHLIKPFILNNELGIDVLEQHLRQSKELTKTVKKEGGELDTFIREIVDKAKILEKDHQNFEDYAQTLIKVENKDATDADRLSFYNRLSDLYINNKSKEYFATKEIAKQYQILDDLLKDENLNSEDLLSRDESKYKSIIKGNPRASKVHSEIVKLEQQLKAAKVASEAVWNSKEAQVLFDKQVTERIVIDKEVTKIEEINAVLTTIANSTTIDDLEAITIPSTVAKSEIENAIKLKKKQLAGQEKIETEEEIDTQETQSTESEIEEDTANVELEDTLDFVVNNSNRGEMISITASMIRESKKKLQNIDEDNNLMFIEETDDTVTFNILETGEEVTFDKKKVKDNVDNPEVEFFTEGGNNSELLIPHNNENKEDGSESKRGNGSPIVTFNRTLKEFFSFVNKRFISKEQEPYDKKGIKVNFSINLTAGKLIPEDNKLIKAKKIIWQKAINTYNKSLKGTKLTQKEIDELIDYLPINAILGEEGAPLQTKYKSNNNYDKFNSSSRLLRLKIINALLEGIKIEDITSSIQGQYQGELQVSPKIDGKVQENQITSLHFLNGVKDKVAAIKERIGFINLTGEFQYTDGNIHPYFTKINAKGEIYLEIPMANGNNFPLKLNIQKVQKTDADLLTKIYELLFTNKELINNITLLELEDKELAAEIKTVFKEQIKLIGKSNKDITLKNIIDFIIWDGADSIKSRVELLENPKSGDKSFIYGNAELDGKIIKGKDTFDREHFSNWLQNNKRYNINIKPKLNSDTKATVQTNNNYLDFLLKSKILNTNAIVGENNPTFQGYSSIYLNSEDINISGKENKQEIIRKDQNKVVPLQEVPNTEENKKVEKIKKATTKTDKVDIESAVFQEMVVKMVKGGLIQFGSVDFKAITALKTNKAKLEALDKLDTENKYNIKDKILNCNG